MEFAAFVICMSIIAQINAAPTPTSGLNIPHQDNEFELPPVARGGFEMNITIEVDEKYQGSLHKMKLIMLPYEDIKSEFVTKYCKNENRRNETHTHICILPHELQNKNGQHQSTTTQKVRILARLNGEEEKLDMLVFLNGDHVSINYLPLDKFDDLKHFSVGGVAGDIQKLQFDFTNEL